MLNTPVYLRPDIKLEPLVDHWYAWSNLIPPANSARYLTERHLRIMDSYIADPQIHAAAVRNPKMLGGPFIDYEGKRVGAIKELRDATRSKRATLVKLSEALTKLDDMLRTEAKGLSLHPLYKLIPDMLKGYVELVYDLNNNPSFKLLEPLFYKSPYYAKDAQSLLLSRIENDERPFALSTPRLDSPDAAHLRMSFDAEGVDRLFRMTATPRPFKELLDVLPELNGDGPVFRSFFTTEAPRPYSPYKGTGVRWRYFGHACILVETNGASILVDPVLSYTYENNISRYTYADLPERIDYVFITHNHQDHVLFETLLQIRHKVSNIIVPRSGGGSLQDPSLKLVLENIGFSNVIELSDMQVLNAGEFTITGVPFFGEHADLDVRSKIGYLVRTAGHAMMFVADSCNVEPMLYEHVARETGPVDVLFIGMECDGAPLTWLYGPLLTKQIDRAVDQSRRLSGSDYEQAVSMVNHFGCKEVYVYAMGQEPWLNYVMSIKYTAQSRPITESNRLIEECTRRGIVAERLFGEKEILVERRPN
jgi:L-ascorbate metabolism protein UlaG (beta-lactamase superfamily)